MQTGRKANMRMTPQAAADWGMYMLDQIHTLPPDATIDLMESLADSGVEYQLLVGGGDLPELWVTYRHGQPI